MLFLILFLINCGGHFYTRSALDFNNLGATLLSATTDLKASTVDEPIQIVSGTQKNITFLTNSGVPQIISVTSEQNNLIEVIDNSVSYTNTKSVFSDILNIKFTLNGTTYQQKKELIIRHSTKKCLGIYLAGDNNLNGVYNGKYYKSHDYVLKDIIEIATSKFTKENLIVFLYIDLDAIAFSNYDQYTFADSGYYVIEKGVIERVRNLEERNTGEAATMRKFLNRMTLHVNAAEYLLDYWAHGLAPFGGAAEKVGGEWDFLTFQETESAITGSGATISTIIFSACLMLDIGSLWHLKDIRYISGPADFVPAVGTFYGNSSEKGIVQYLSETSDSPLNIAKEIAKINYNSFFTQGQQLLSNLSYLTYAAIDQFHIDEVKTRLTDLLSLNINPFETEVKARFKYFNGNIDSSSYNPSDPTYILDFVSFSEALAEHSNTSIKDKGNLLKDTLLNKYLVYKKHASNRNSGVSIFFNPDVLTGNFETNFSTNSLTTFLANFNFYEETAWSALMTGAARFWGP